MYVTNKVNYFIEKVNKELNLEIGYEDVYSHFTFDVKTQNNIRILTRDIEQAVATVVNDKL